MHFNFPDSITLLKQYTIIYQTENRVKNSYKQREWLWIIIGVSQKNY